MEAQGIGAAKVRTWPWWFLDTSSIRTRRTASPCSLIVMRVSGLIFRIPCFITGCGSAPSYISVTWTGTGRPRTSSPGWESTRLAVGIDEVDVQRDTLHAPTLVLVPRALPVRIVSDSEVLPRTGERR